MDTSNPQAQNPSSDEASTINELNSVMADFNATTAKLDGELQQASDNVQLNLHEAEKGADDMLASFKEFEKQHGGEAESSILGMIDAEAGDGTDPE